MIDGLQEASFSLNDRFLHFKSWFSVFDFEVALEPLVKWLSLQNRLDLGLRCQLSTHSNLLPLVQLLHRLLSSQNLELLFLLLDFLLLLHIFFWLLLHPCTQTRRPFALDRLPHLLVSVQFPHQHLRLFLFLPRRFLQRNLWTLRHYSLHRDGNRRLQAPHRRHFVLILLLRYCSTLGQLPQLLLNLGSLLIRFHLC